jgi:hypothetical protein
MPTAQIPVLPTEKSNQEYNILLFPSASFGPQLHFPDGGHPIRCHPTTFPPWYQHGQANPYPLAKDATSSIAKENISAASVET